MVFQRESNGLLTFKSCVTEAGNNGCANVRGVSQLQSGAISPDSQVLAAKNSRGGGTGGISFFDIDGSIGALTQRAGAAGCITNDGSVPDGAGGTTLGQCTAKNVLGGEGNIEFSSNTILNYGSFQSGSAVVFDRDFKPVCNNVGTSVPHNTAASVSFSCSDVNNDPISYEIVSNPTAGNPAAIDQANARVL